MISIKRSKYNNNEILRNKTLRAISFYRTDNTLIHLLKILSSQKLTENDPQIDKKNIEKYVDSR